jgi:CMP-N-acetylneuraminic acid synthetase
MIVYAIIPARGGSKGVPRKNVKELAGVPLIAFTVTAALECKAFGRVFVSTDDEGIASVAARWGADVPFMRPAAFAQDKSPDRDYLDHAFKFFREGGERVDALAILRPTTPLRDPMELSKAVGHLMASAEATGLRSVHALPEPPQKMMGIENGWLTGLFPHDPRPEYFNLPRQSFPTAYQPNGYVDIVTAKGMAASSGGIYGRHILGFVTPVTVEVDTIEEFDYLEYIIARTSPPILDLIERRNAAVT